MRAGVGQIWADFGQSGVTFDQVGVALGKILTDVGQV